MYIFNLPIMHVYIHTCMSTFGYINTQVYMCKSHESMLWVSDGYPLNEGLEEWTLVGIEF